MNLSRTLKNIVIPPCYEHVSALGRNWLVVLSAFPSIATAGAQYFQTMIMVRPAKMIVIFSLKTVRVNRSQFLKMMTGVVETIIYTINKLGLGLKMGSCISGLESTSFDDLVPVDSWRTRNAKCQHEESVSKRY